MEKFEFKNSYNDILYGIKWEVKNPKKIIVLLTGLCEYASRYNEFALFLNSNGYSVYCLDHYGQGENVLKKEQYGTAPENYFFKMADTIFELVMHLEDKLKLEAYLIGHSMGSLILQESLIRHVNLTKKAVLIGTAGPMFISKPGYYLLKLLTNKNNFDKPSILANNLSIGPFVKSVKNRKYDCEWISYNEENYKKYNEDEKCNYIRSWGAQLGLAHGVSSLHKKKRMKNVNQNTDILILCGNDDPVSNNTKTAKKLTKLYIKTGHEASKINEIYYEKMRHEILNEKNKMTVYKDILDFIEK